MGGSTASALSDQAIVRATPQQPLAARALSALLIVGARDPSRWNPAVLLQVGIALGRCLAQAGGGCAAPSADRASAPGAARGGPGLLIRGGCRGGWT